MFKIEVSLCDCQPHLSHAIPQLLKSTEWAIKCLFTDLMIVKGYTMPQLHDSFDGEHQNQYHKLLNNAIQQYLFQYGHALPANSGPLLCCITKLPIGFWVQWWIAGKMSDLCIDYHVTPDCTQLSNVTLNDIKW